MLLLTGERPGPEFVLVWHSSGRVRLESGGVRREVRADNHSALESDCVVQFAAKLLRFMFAPSWVTLHTDGASMAAAPTLNDLYHA